MNEKHSLLRGYLLGIGAPPEMLEALDALLPPAPEEIQTPHEEQSPADFKHFFPEIKSMQKQGMDAQQISNELRHSKALRFTHERRKPSLQTIESIMNSKAYSKFDEN